MAQGNISGAITRAVVLTKKSEKTGNDYTQLKVTFNMPNEGSYDFVTFLTNEQKTLLEMAQPLKDEKTIFDE